MAEFVSQYDVTYRPNNRKNVIKLHHKRGYIVKRGSPCVIRYFLKYTDENEYMRALCILFLPFRCEKEDIHLNDIQSLYNDNEDRIEEIRQQFEKHRSLVEKIQIVEEERSDELVDNLESDDEFIEDETTEPSKIKEFEKLAQDQAKRVITSHNAGIQRMEIDEYQHLLNSLNEEQGQLFNDFCERILDVSSSEPFYLYISGTVRILVIQMKENVQISCNC